MHASPLLSIVVVSYNRSSYLRELLNSLLDQDSPETFELVLLDNGSTSPIAEELADLLSQLPGPVTLLREEQNLLSPTRWRLAAESASGEFVLTPGDDDVLLPHYIRSMSELARSHPSVTLISTSVQLIDSTGDRLGGRITPPQFRSQPEALGRLLARDDYPMPGSGFRRSEVDLREAPLTRTAFDWWLWMQCWLAGTAAVSEEPSVLYRQHPGQEQRHYGTQSFRMDAARMMLAHLHSRRFRDVVDAWSAEDIELFISSVTGSVGPNYGDTRWGPLVQVALTEIIRDRLPATVLIDMYAQAAGQSGSIASVGDLQALAGAPLAAGCLPRATWSRVPITARWAPNCSMVGDWTQFLQLPDRGRAAITVDFRCSCVDRPWAPHQLTARLTRTDRSTQVLVHLAAPPSDGAVAPLLDAIGALTGRPHGFEVPTTTELKVLDTFARFRASNPGVVLERSLRWARRRWSRQHRS